MGRHPRPGTMSGVPEIIILLKVKPQFGSGLKRLRKPQGHIGSHGSSLIHNLGERLARHSQGLRNLGDV